MRDARPTHWAGIGEGTFVGGMVFLSWVYRVLGRWPFRLCMLPVVLFFWLTYPHVRQSSREYLQRLHAHAQAQGKPVFAHPPGALATVCHLVRFGDTLLDKLLAASGRFPRERVQVDRAVVKEQLERGQGGVILTAHIGCLELCQALSDTVSSMKVTALVHTAHAQKYNRLLQRLNPHTRLELLQVTAIDPAVAMRLAERVNAGEFIAIVGDRIPVTGGRVAWAPFLGHRAPFPIGAYVLASALGCPVFTMACVHAGDGYTVTFERFADRIVLPRGAREQALAGYAAQFSAWLERQMRRAPLDWFNFFRFWDQVPHDASA